MKNREIKFRIWNGSKMENNIMAGFLGAFYVQGIDEKDTACMSPFNTKYDGTAPLMQYTQLFDRNGKEIYEGDILEVSTKDKTGYQYVGQVLFDNELAMFQLKFNEDFMFNKDLYCWNKKSKILGNIYENADLLTA